MTEQHTTTATTEAEQAAAYSATVRAAYTGPTAAEVLEGVRALADSVARHRLESAARIVGDPEGAAAYAAARHAASAANCANAAANDAKRAPRALLEAWQGLATAATLAAVSACSAAARLEAAGADPGAVDALTEAGAWAFEAGERLDIATTAAAQRARAATARRR